jgi:cytochrome c-type biogenesis protein CcmH
MRSAARAALAAVASLGVLAGACREKSSTAPPPSSPPSTDARPEAVPMRPLTSRDGTPPEAPAPAASLPPGHPPIGASADARGPSIEGEIRLDERLRDQAQSGRVLYVIARNAASRQVAAVRKEEGPRFPFAFRISGADAMMEGVSFDGPFDLTARLSRSGDAIPQPGDLEGTAKGVAAGARGVTLIIDTTRR